MEAQLAGICEQVAARIQSVIPAAKLDALVLGGGYGRGEGGVLRTVRGDQPYNDIEFYVFLRGLRLWNQRKYAQPLNALSRELSVQTGLHVEFKIDSLARLRDMPICMFTYDLIAAHRVLFGQGNVFAGCDHHLTAAEIPLSEATRLLFNRCTGLLLVRELLRRANLSPEESDFAGRNLAKAQLALGDAVLTTLGQYHWSARVRGERLQQLADEGVPELPAVQKHHRAGLEFKLYPKQTLKTPEHFALEHRELSALAQRLWLWIESRRLNRPFSTVKDYAFCEINKCPETVPAKNYLITMRTFGAVAALKPLASRYPRERLFNSLPLLLWNGEVSREPEIQRHLQRQLRSTASDWSGLVAAYKEIWPGYG